MKVYDKAKWHIDAGEEKGLVLGKFKAVFEFLKQNDLLTSEGIEIFDLGIDESVSLHERLVKDVGKKILESHYDSIIGLEPREMSIKLKSFM